MGGEARRAGQHHMIAGVRTASPTVGVLSVNACRKPADSDRNEWARRPGARIAGRTTHGEWRAASAACLIPCTTLACPLRSADAKWRGGVHPRTDEGVV